MPARITSVLKKFGRKQQSWWPVVAAVVFLVVASVFAYSPSVIPVPPADAQNNVPNMSGWAWSSNIGWISTSCANTTPGCTTWGLTLDPDVSGKRYIRGYAWNEKIGWIKFDPVAAPDPAYPAGTNTVADKVFLRTSDNRVLGWARACNVFVSNCSGSLKPDSDRGGWDGWISLGRTDSVPGGAGNTQNPYGVRVTPTVVNGVTNLIFDYFAWGQTILGWVDFNPRTGFGVTCCTNDQGLTVTKTGSGNGAVSSIAPSGAINLINCGADCVQDGFSGPITLQATPASGSNFSTNGWSSNCTPVAGNPTQCTINVPSNGSRTVVNADFSTSGGSSSNFLRVDLLGSGTGVVNSIAPSSAINLINCPGDCRQDNFTGPITLEANPGNNSSFNGWSSNCTPVAGNPNRCTMVVPPNAGATVVIASFGILPCVGDDCNSCCDPDDLTVAIVGSGKVVSAPVGKINCGDGNNDCTENNLDGADQDVTLVASVVNGSTFQGWSTNCEVDPTEPVNPMQCTVHVSGATTVTATFTGGGQPCLVEGPGGVQALGSNTLTVDLGGRSGAFINSTGMLMEMLTSFPGVNVSISASSSEINNFDSSLLYTDQELCVHSAATAPGLTCLSTENTGLVQGTRKNRTLWLKVPHTGKDNQLDPSVYMGCNDSLVNGGQGCKVTVTIDPTSGTSCDHAGPDTSITLDYFVKFRDSSISPQGAGN